MKLSQRYMELKTTGLLAGKSISLQDVEELFHSANQRQKMHYLPPEIIAWSRNEVIWFEKSRIRPIYFNVPEPKRKFLNEISGQKCHLAQLGIPDFTAKHFLLGDKKQKQAEFEDKVIQRPVYQYLPPSLFLPANPISGDPGRGYG